MIANKALNSWIKCSSEGLDVKVYEWLRGGYNYLYMQSRINMGGDKFTSQMHFLPTFEKKSDNTVFIHLREIRSRLLDNDIDCMKLDFEDYKRKILENTDSF